MLKRCSICGKDKILTDFHKYSKSKDGLRSECKLCRKLHTPIPRKKLVALNPNNKVCWVCRLEKSKLEFRENTAPYSTVCLRCRQLQKDERSIARRKSDPLFKFRKTLSVSIGYYLKKQGSSKRGGSIKNNLPYTTSELCQHLEKQFEPWMTWDNHSVYDAKIWNDTDPSTWTWQLDHIIPQSDLPYASMEDDNFKKCWALENLRPLSSKQNVVEGVNRTRHATSTR